MLAVAVVTPAKVPVSYGRMRNGEPRELTEYAVRTSRPHYVASRPLQQVDFYVLLRWICCAVFTYSAFVAFQMKRIASTWIFGALAVLFNPIARIFLQRNNWKVVDCVAIGVIVVAAIIFWQNQRLRVNQ
jgi:hypothetical protein